MEECQDRIKLTNRTRWADLCELVTRIPPGQQCVIIGKGDTANRLLRRIAERPNVERLPNPASGAERVAVVNRRRGSVGFYRPS